jgi:hypothetical protein
MWKRLAESGSGLKQGKSFEAVGAVTAMNSLNQARNTYLRTVTGYNRPSSNCTQPWASHPLMHSQAQRLSVKVPVVPPTPAP